MTLSRVRSVIAAIVLMASVSLGSHSIWVFSRIGPPPPPVTTIFGPGYARWEKQRRVETNVGMREAFALDYINSFGIPASMGMALAALILAFLGWPARRLDRYLSVVSGAWLLVLFALSFRFGTEYRVGALRGCPVERDAVQPRVAADGACAPPLNA